MTNAYMTPTTELEAVNAMLATIGESPVNTLVNLSADDAIVAHDTLIEITRAVLTEGWHFNTEADFPLIPEIGTGEIRLPLNCISCDVEPAYRDVDVVQRGRRLYDRKTHSYRFDRMLRAEMLVLLSFEELPEAARQYCYIRAARVFQERAVGSELLTSFTAREEARARMVLERSDALQSDANMLTGNDRIRRIIRR